MSMLSVCKGLKFAQPEYSLDILPGLDGTGLLFRRLVENLPREAEVEVISYENIEALSFTKQARAVASKYLDEELFIVCESYSGKVAYELYQLQKKHVKGIVFLASFISRQSLFSIFAHFFPVSLLTPNFLTKSSLYYLGFNSSGGKGLVDSVFDSLKYANKTKLKSRLRNISRLRSPSLEIACPVVYVRPSKDRLVTPKAVKRLASTCSSYKEASVTGGHFIALANPVACAEIINDALCMQ